MYATILFVLLFLIFIYVGSFSLLSKEKGDKKLFRFLYFGIRALQIYLIFTVFAMAIDLMIFLLTGEFTIINSSFINDDFSSIFRFGIPILVSLSIAGNLIYLVIGEIIWRIIEKMEEGFHFNHNIVLKMRLISKLLILFVLTRFVYGYVQTNLFTFRFDTLFFYGLLIILIRIFEHGVIVQEDSDLAI